jgi:hypothetical protein
MCVAVYGFFADLVSTASVLRQAAHIPHVRHGGKMVYSSEIAISWRTAETAFRFLPGSIHDGFNLRVVYDKTGDRLSISATLTEAVASMLRTGLKPLCNRLLRGWDSNPQPLD